MAYEELIRNNEIPSNIILENRGRLSVSGIEDVISFDENLVAIHTSRGTLVIRGSGLHMEKLTLDSGEIMVEGTVDSMEYENEESSREGFFTRLFK